MLPKSELSRGKNYFVHGTWTCPKTYSSDEFSEHEASATHMRACNYKSQGNLAIAFANGSVGRVPARHDSDSAVSSHSSQAASCSSGPSAESSGGDGSLEAQHASQLQRWMNTLGFTLVTRANCGSFPQWEAYRFFQNATTPLQYLKGARSHVVWKEMVEALVSRIDENVLCDEGFAFYWCCH